MARLLITLLLIVLVQICLGEDKREFQYKLISRLSEINKNATREDVTQCLIHMGLYYSGIQAMEMWALNMLDATAKINSGLLVGNDINMGNFDQCLSVEYNTGSSVIKGQHCMVYSTVDLNNLPSIPDIPDGELKSSHMDSRTKHSIAKLFNMQVNSRDDTAQELTLGFGLCVPASCQGKELMEQLEGILELANITMDVDTEYDSARYCSSKERNKFSAGDWVAIIIFAIIGMLMVLSTLYELSIVYGSSGNQKKGTDIGLAFSVISNTKRIFSIHPNPPDNVRSDSITSIHGIRVLSILWVVIGHKYAITSVHPLSNPLDLLDWIGQHHSPIIIGATISVDTFFVISGALLAYSFMKDRAKGMRMNVPLMYIHRYLRLTPPLAAMVLFQTTLVSYIGSGPYWKQINHDYQQRCIDYWWSALLYVQNYVNPSKVCVAQSWYLDVDMQVYILSPILLYALWRYPKHAIGAAVVLILANVGIVFGLVYANEFGGGVEADGDVFDVIYVPGHARFGPMIMGMLLGYALFKTLKVEVKLNKLLVVILWLCSFAVMLAVVFGAYPLNQIDYVKNVLEAAFYKSLHRIVWSLAICWIIFACTVGYGGLINWLLSHQLWQPLSRLSYCLYITHAVIQIAIAGARKYPTHFSDLDMIYQFWGDLGLALTATVIWSLAFESPVTILEKIMLGKPKRAAQNTVAVQDTPSLENGHDNNIVKSNTE